ncbi:MAG: CCA tRNA nucleotidyltransferase [Clostridiales bacterium]|jgi:tRNA nucleotidyltransferase (CCA-adding enzyme)|nr:CCA tRNA nucleotidyltransferase [Eubacteriales bacterium]MDH7565604.1 CCA tRNA nucleotidyltransferase [Clostridiales bacterium]
MKTKNMEVPPEVHEIIETLNGHGFEAYLVGGCVRDSILGRIPSDWDIATNAKPHEVKNLFKKTVNTGVKHGTVTLPANDASYEVTTYRTEGAYIDHRRPGTVRFTSSLKEDLGRRDFTVNAIAYHPLHGYVDFYNGMEDISRRVIRTVGDPARRFGEDALRMLRAVRFCAQLDFSMEEGTFHSIRENSSLIDKISGERIRDELTKILLSQHPLKFSLLNDTGLLQYILPEFIPCFSTGQKHPYHIYDVAEHTLRSVGCIAGDKILRWTMLLHDIGKPGTKTTDAAGIDHFYGHPRESANIAGQVLKRLRFDNKSAKSILDLIEYHDKNIEPSPKSVKRFVRQLGEDLFLDLLKVKEADKRAQNPQYSESRLKELERIRSIFYGIKEKGECMDLKDLAVDGNDLMSLGFKRGKEIGEMLDRLLELVIDNPELNSRDRLMDIVARGLNK